jgi:hypothetical protein
MSCDSSLQSEKFGQDSDNYTSQVNIYDGVTFSCLELGESPTLNSVLQVFGNAICTLISGGGDSGGTENIDVSNVIWEGSTTLQTYINQITSDISDLQESVSGIGTYTMDDILFGDTLSLPDCFDGTYTSESTLTSVFQEAAGLICENKSDIQTVKDYIAATHLEIMQNQEMLTFEGGSGDYKIVSGSGVEFWNSAGGGISRFLVNGKYTEVSNSAMIVTDNSDNYIEVREDGTYGKVAVPIGDPVPSPVSGQFIWKVQKNLGVMLSAPNFTDLRNYKYINKSSKIGDEIIQTIHLADEAVSSAKMTPLIAAGTKGSSNFFQITVDVSGRVSNVTSSASFSSLSDGDYMRWNASAGQWQNVAGSTVVAPSANEGDVMYYDGTNWAASSMFDISASSIGVNYTNGQEHAHQFQLGNGLWLSFGSRFLGPDSITLTSGGTLSASTEYFYRIQYEDAGGQLSLPSEEESEVTTVSDKTVNVSVKFPNGIVGARVWRSTTSGSYSDYIDITEEQIVVDDGSISWSSGSIVDIDKSRALLVGQSGILFGENDPQSMMSLYSKTGALVNVAKFRRESSSIIDSYALTVENKDTSNENNYGIKVSTENSTSDNVSVWVESGRLAMGSNPASFNTNALAEFSSTEKGILLPRMTTIERDAVSWVAGDAGMVIFNVTDSKFQGWDGSAWNNLH